jgi:hypothetical protein
MEDCYIHDALIDHLIRDLWDCPSGRHAQTEIESGWCAWLTASGRAGSRISKSREKA